MKFLRRLMFWKRPDLGDELDFYLEMRERELRAQGLSPEDARHAARKALGNSLRIAEESREVWIARWLDELSRDLTYAVRNLAAAPMFAFMTIGALGLGIGFNTSLFTFFNSIALQPWSLREPDRVATVLQVQPGNKRNPFRGLQHPFYVYLRDHAQTVSGIAAENNAGQMIFEINGERITAPSSITSGNYFEVVGIPLALGRPYTDEDDQVGREEVAVVLSYDFWEQKLGKSRDIIGKTLTMNRQPARVMGVAAEDFRGTSAGRTSVWYPIRSEARFRPGVPGMADNPNQCCLGVYARLAPGVTREKAQAEMTVLGNVWLRDHQREAHGMLLTPPSFLANPGMQARFKPALMLLSLAVGMVLLLTCLNVSNLLLVRASARRKELGVRRALGAGRGRLIRQLLTESLLLSVGGAAVGLVVAYVVPSAIMTNLVSESLSFRFVPDRTVLLFSILMSLMATVAVGLLPALDATRGQLLGSLRGEAVRLRNWDLRRMLAAAQVGLCCILLTGAGLLLRAMVHASSQDPGFDTRNLVVLRVDLPLFGYREETAKTFGRALEDRLRLMSVVEDVTHATILPFGNATSASDFVTTDGRKLDRALEVDVAPQHLQALKIPLTAGRYFNAGDTARPVAIVNEALARRVWGDVNVVGRKFRRTNEDREIVGVMRDSLTGSYASRAEPTYFTPAEAGPSAAYLVRLRDANQTALVRDAVWTVDRQVVPLVNRLETDIAQTLKPARLTATIALGLGLFALTLACVGLYGVVAYNVAQRTQEIGVRIALGAVPRTVTRMVLGQNLRAVFVGLLIGLVAAAGVSRILGSLLYGLSALDPIAYSGVVACLLVAVLAASILPARRAATVDPMKALRAE
jgi:predicted permease